MDYTLSPDYATHAGTGNRMHEENAAVTTVWSEKDANSVIWSLMQVVKDMGLVGVPFDEAVPGSYQVLVKAIKRASGLNVTTVNAGASPFSLTADHAGLVLVDATAGNVVINLPAANVLAGLPYAFRRTDTSVNTVTVNRADADTIDEGEISFALTSKAIQQVRANGATTWSTVTSVAASQAEINAGTDDAKFVTSKKVRAGFAASFAASGYIAFPTWLGGFIIQWGTTVEHVSSGNVGTNAFPISFITAAYRVVLTDSSSTNNNAVVWAADAVGLGSFTSYWNPSGTAAVSTTRVAGFIAVGK